MTNAIVQVGLFFIIFTLVSVPFGLYMARVFSDERTFMDPVLKPLERLIYRVCGIRPATEMTWFVTKVAIAAGLPGSRWSIRPHCGSRRR